MYQITGHILKSVAYETSKQSHFRINFAKSAFMAYNIEDIEDQTRFRLLLCIQYNDLVGFVLSYLKKKSSFILMFWALCAVFLAIAVYFRITLHPYFPLLKIIRHSLIGFIVLPLLIIPLHELLHIIPYLLTGARNIRVGMDLRQYLFYVTAHRYVANPSQFKVVAIFPFAFISLLLIILICLVPDLWKWSLSAFMFTHATMCAGDFALLNFYFLNSDKEIYTWDDADRKEAYFYQKLS
jgi:hypothetical protein